MISLEKLNQEIREILCDHRCEKLVERRLEDAIGEVVAEDVVSKVSIPSDDVSAMDGYAVVAGSGLQKGDVLSNIGLSKAGKPFDGVIHAGECIRIMTGAVVPDGADSVIMQEHVHVEGDQILLDVDLPAGKNIRYRGEEITEGKEVILARGTILTPADILLLASCGYATVKTTGRLKVGIFSTGDELVLPGETLKKGEIYDSNRWMIQSLLSRLPVEILDYGLIADDLDATKQVLESASQACDVVITSGGVSVGDFDYLKTAVESLGEIHHYKVNMKPGKPFVFGKIGSAWYFGLPGNPVSGFVGFTQIISPALHYLLGVDRLDTLTMKVVLGGDLVKRHDRQDFQRGLLEKREGEWVVVPQGRQDSHRVYALARANCFIVLDEKDGNKTKGEIVHVIPFESRFGMGGWM